MSYQTVLSFDDFSTSPRLSKSVREDFARQLRDMRASICVMKEAAMLAGDNKQAYALNSITNKLLVADVVLLEWRGGKA